ncbi:hypothetical protein BRCON_0169 [Candidatus Sumerlaea chitinivorans]|uniref:Uncharacterized protein n=1 Tax=Sumerlaea chitinivorans TaxID=2250252 RepID=A0A2Z4Y201_SUMC1|nr:hypothetical protein BRCON_0169 [Candidatus Sumerlaea chitinivorans]
MYGKAPPAVAGRLNVLSGEFQNLTEPASVGGRPASVPTPPV